MRRIVAGLPTVVATGTGSGKTEAFLMPIIDHCLRVAAPDTLKAILVYAMNALANDQRGRIRKLLAGTEVSFGVYTGETRQWGQRPDGIPENERLMRSEFRAHPPDILLTNYRMLEYRGGAMARAPLDEGHDLRLRSGDCGGGRSRGFTR